MKQNGTIEETGEKGLFKIYGPSEKEIDNLQSSYQTHISQKTKKLHFIPFNFILIWISVRFWLRLKKSTFDSSSLNRIVQSKLIQTGCLAFLFNTNVTHFKLWCAKKKNQRRREHKIPDTGESIRSKPDFVWENIFSSKISLLKSNEIDWEREKEKKKGDTIKIIQCTSNRQWYNDSPFNATKGIKRTKNKWKEVKKNEFVNRIIVNTTIIEIIIVKQANEDKKKMSEKSEQKLNIC